MSAGSKETNKKTTSPVLKSKLSKRKFELANSSISDEILSQLIMDDSWVEACSKPSNTIGTEQPKVACENCPVGSSEKSRQSVHKYDQKTSNPSIYPSENSSLNRKGFAKEPDKTLVPCKKSTTPVGSIKKKKYLFTSKQYAQLSNIPQKTLSISNLANANTIQNTKPPRNCAKTIQASTRSTVKTVPDENFFSDEDEELLLQAVVLSESQKSAPIKVSPPKVEVKNLPKKCSAAEIEKKKQEAIKRRLQRLKK